MSNRYEYRFSGNNNSPFSGIVGILVGVLFILGLFYFLKFLFNLLWILLPVLLIVTAVIDYKVFISYGKWIIRLFQRNWIAGLIAGFLSVAGAPVVTLFLLGKALFQKKVKEARAAQEEQTQGEYVEFEEVDSETLDLPQLEPKKQTRQPSTNDDYEQLFED
jgi:hypothetical protein